MAFPPAVNLEVYTMETSVAGLFSLLRGLVEEIHATGPVDLDAFGGKIDEAVREVALATETLLPQAAGPRGECQGPGGGSRTPLETALSALEIMAPLLEPEERENYLGRLADPGRGAVRAQALVSLVRHGLMSLERLRRALVDADPRALLPLLGAMAERWLVGLESELLALLEHDAGDVRLDTLKTLEAVGTLASIETLLPLATGD
jgi:hypothetical protein